MPTMKHQIEGLVFLKVKFKVLGRIGAVELDIDPEIVFDNPRMLQEMIDKGIDEFLVQHALQNAPPGVVN